MLLEIANKSTAVCQVRESAATVFAACVPYEVQVLTVLRLVTTLMPGPLPADKC